MKREEALKLLRKYLKDEKLVKHCIATGAIMRMLARELGENEERWEVVGILHDIDYEVVEKDMKRHGSEGERILLKEGVEEGIARVVGRHNHFALGIGIEEYEEPIEIALQCADNLSGLVIACALVKGGKLSEVSVKTVKKKFKEKCFAAGCLRENIRLVEKLGIQLERAFELAIEGMLSVKDELGLR